MTIRSVSVSGGAANVALGNFAGYTTGRCYATSLGVPATAAVAAIDTIYLYPFQVFQTFTFTGLTLRVTTGGTGSSAKAGIWANSTASFRPVGAPLAVDNTGVATTTSSASANFTTGNFTLNAGTYWVGTKHTGTLPTVQVIAANVPVLAFFSGLPNSATALATGGLSFADTYSNNMPTLAELASFTAVTGALPHVGLLT